MMVQKLVRISIVLLFITTSGSAQPDFKRVVEHDGVRCFFDAQKPLVAYYSPDALSMAVDETGKPDFNFLQTRYTGNVAYNDRWEARFRSMLRFRVKMAKIPSEKLSKVKRALWPSGEGHLRPVPITDIKTVISFTPLVDESNGGGNEEVVPLSNGHLTAEGKEGVNNKGLFWKEREFTVKLDEYSSQALDNAFELGQSLMSLSYAFFSTGTNQLENSFVSDGENEILYAITKQAEGEKDSAVLEQVCVRSDAFSIVIDKERWPDLVRQVDINEELPSGYAALEVRCYDFNNNLRPDLFAKKIEIKATGVGRGDVMVKSTFSRKSPDVYVFNVKFPYAVRLDKPLFYRVTSISDEAAPVKTEWMEQSLWTGMIDITSNENQIIQNDEDY